MNKLTHLLFIVVTSFFISSCSTELSDYEKVNKNFDIKEYFNGNIVAWGIVQNYTDKVQRRFCVEIEGTWQENVGTLAENFYFDDGEISYRTWQFTKKTDGSYQGTAQDVAGTAIGKHQGFAFQLTYDLMLTLDNETYNVAMDDWMYQLDEYRVMNKTTMSKLGVNVAEITLFFDKELPVKSCTKTQ